MNFRLKLSNYFYIVIISLCTFYVEAKSFPKNFHSEYQLYQEESFLGEVIVDFRKNNNKYEINALTRAEGIMRLLGNREIISKGQLSSNGFTPKKFELKNEKKPKRNVVAIFDYQKDQVQINYKEEISNHLLMKKHLDVLTYLYQFNFESLNKKKYIFEIVDGKKSRTYLYKKIRQEFIETGVGNLEADVYEGEIKGKNNSKHFLWILREPYRVPLKIKIKTDIGIDISQVLVKTNLIID